MKHYVYHDAAGRIRFRCSTPVDATPEPEPGLTVLELAEALPAGEWHVAGGAVVAGRLDLRTLEQIVADQWMLVRAERDQRLAATDWVTLRAIEQGTPVPEEWRAYRQALRDVPLQADPFAITWPVEPAEA
jgi:hypothetical protein